MHPRTPPAQTERSILRRLLGTTLACTFLTAAVPTAPNTVVEGATVPALGYTTVGAHRLDLRFRPFGVAYADQHRIDGKVVDYRAFPLMDNPWVHQDVDGHTLTLRHGGRTRTYDFATWTVASADGR